MAKYTNTDVRTMIDCTIMCMKKLNEIEFSKDASESDCALVSASLAQACTNATKFILKNGKLTPAMREFFKKSVECSTGIMLESMQVMDECAESDEDDESDYYDDESEWMDDDEDDDAPKNITDKDLDAYAEYYGLNKEERKVLAKIVANKGSREGMTAHQIEVGKKIASKVDAKEGGHL